MKYNVHNLFFAKCRWPIMDMMNIEGPDGGFIHPDYMDYYTIMFFKNNYEDPKFIRNATVTTIIVIGLEIIIKFFLFKEQKILQFSNPLDVMLSVIQIGLLVYSIYGYNTKKSSTKYISIIVSVLIVLTLDIWDIILGVLYFIYSIDQSWFIKIINSLSKKGDKNV